MNSWVLVGCSHFLINVDTGLISNGFHLQKKKHYLINHKTIRIVVLNSIIIYLTHSDT